MIKDANHPAYPVAVDNDSSEEAICFGEVIAPKEIHYFGGFTKRQAAAIKLRVPDSETEWLDDMIRTSNRNELAARAMHSLLEEFLRVGQFPDETWMRGVSCDCFKMADAILAQGEVK